MNNDIFMGLAHVAVYTDKYEETVNFYTKILPMQLVKELREVRAEDDSGFFPLKYALIKLNELYIEIMETADKRTYRRDGCFHHIGIHVSDVDKAITYLLEKGYPKNQIPEPSVNTTLYPGKTFKATAITGINGETIGLYEQDNKVYFDEG